MANCWLKDPDQTFHKIRVLEKRWTNCISVAEGYIGQWPNVIYISFG